MQEHGVDPDGRLDVILKSGFRSYRSYDDVKAIAMEIVGLNPHLTTEKVMQCASFDEAGDLVDW